jgi:L-threonylcarbamoyladenylate synthase
MLGHRDAETFARCIRIGGVAVFPADTVYGLACEPETPEAVERLYAIKGRRPDKPAAVMFFDRDLAFDALPELEPRTRALLERLLPGGITALLPNPLRRYPLACGPDPHTLGLRVPRLDGALEALRAMRRPVLQSSANDAGGMDAQTLDEVPEDIRREADLVLDGGELAGTPSTVIDLRRFELDGIFAVLRAGAVAEHEIDRAAAELA